MSMLPIVVIIANYLKAFLSFQRYPFAMAPCIAISLRDRFVQKHLQNLLNAYSYTYMNLFPAANSVIIMDNCQIHKHPDIQQLIGSRCVVITSLYIS